MMKSFSPPVFVCATRTSLLCQCMEHLLAKMPKTEFASEPPQPWNAKLAELIAKGRNGKVAPAL